MITDKERRSLEALASSSDPENWKLCGSLILSYSIPSSERPVIEFLTYDLSQINPMIYEKIIQSTLLEAIDLI